jgi:hypothetical protein
MPNDIENRRMPTTVARETTLLFELLSEPVRAGHITVGKFRRGSYVVTSS